MNLDAPNSSTTFNSSQNTTSMDTSYQLGHLVLSLLKTMPGNFRLGEKLLAPSNE